MEAPLNNLEDPDIYLHEFSGERKTDIEASCAYFGAEGGLQACTTWSFFVLIW